MSKLNYPLASRLNQTERSVFSVNQQVIGGDKLLVIAGPCSIEDEQQMLQTAESVASSGANALRGGAFKPRTSPYDFQGLGEKGLIYLQRAAAQYNLLSVSELMDSHDLELVCSYVDIIQIGARNMQNFSLLKALGHIGKPVILNRGLSATYSELLGAAEYILSNGNPQVILCERGIRTFETTARNTLDLAAVPILQELTHLPVIVDPSHATGLRHVVPKMMIAAVAAGADGIMVEVHPRPDESISDAKQTISLPTFAHTMHVVRQVRELVAC